MPKLSIDDMNIEYDIVDCTDKIVVLKTPMAVSKDKLMGINEAIRNIKETCNAKDVIAIPQYMSFSVRSIDKTINILNRLIIKLTKDKERLESMRDNKNGKVKY